MRARLIINPVSGDSEPNTDKIDQIREALSLGKFDLEVFQTAEENSASDLAKQAVRDAVEIVLVGGGDGTVSEVARALVNSDCTLGIIPIGTFNNVARSLAIPTEIERACKVILDGQIRGIDVGLANETLAFFEAAGAGLDASLFPLGEEIKSGQWGFLLQFLRIAFDYRATPLRITLDRPVSEAIPREKWRYYSTRRLAGREIGRRALFVVVANGPYYGSGFTVAPGASLDDGLFTVAIYRNFSKWELIRHFQSIYRGKRRYSSKVELFTAAEVRVEGRQILPVHVDGHPYGETPLVLRTLPQGLRVLVPRDGMVTPTFQGQPAEMRPEN